MELEIPIKIINIYTLIQQLHLGAHLSYRYTCTYAWNVGTGLFGEVLFRIEKIWNNLNVNR